MVTTVLLALVAGFFVGNGLPYYMLGSTGKTNPTPFGQSAAVNVVVGWVAFVVAAICWRYAHVSGHPLAGYAAAAAGLLAVGLIHARNWHNNPWRNRPLFHRRNASLMLTTILRTSLSDGDVRRHGDLLAPRPRVQPQGVRLRRHWCTGCRSHPRQALAQQRLALA